MFHLLALAVSPVQGRVSQVDLSYQVKAAYIYNILKFVSFPESALHVEGVLNVCVLGEDRFGTALDEINGAGVPQGVINIIHLDDGKPMSWGDCNALYVVETEKRNIKSILSRVDSKAILTIGEFAPFIQYGGLIELFVQDDSIRFRINEDLVKETDFQVAAQLVQLGVR
ncbi:MAG TPA: YfiR family protein [Gammaproteobacteria bacterium]